LPRVNYTSRQAENSIETYLTLELPSPSKWRTSDIFL